MMTTTRFARHALRVRVRILLGCLVFSLLGLNVHQANAGLFTLSDKNSVAQYNTSSQAGVYSWKVDGVEQLAQQWFWFRVGNNPEASLNTLPIAAEGPTDTNFDGSPDNLFTRFAGGGFQVETNFKLQGGAPGSNSSDMTEQIAITNTGNQPLDFHFFQYSDFDLNGTPGGDTAAFTNPNTVRQRNGSTEMSETVVTPVPDHREIDFFNSTLARRRRNR
jgi:hypothetical protein